MSQQLFALLCGLGTVGFTACADRGKQGIYWLAGFVGLFVLIRPLGIFPFNNGLLAVNPTQIAMVLALAAFLKLQKTHLIPHAAVFGGMLAAFWIDMLIRQGYPTVPVITMVTGVALLAFLGSVYRSGFVSPPVLDEALIIILLMALFVAIIPDAISGWQSATSLQGIDAGQGAQTGNPGVLLLIFSFVILGSLYAGWKNR